jgi:hypothetical protein
MNDLISTILIIVAGGGLAAMQASRFRAFESKLMLLSYAAHIGSAFVQIWITRGVYGYGDVLGYTSMGEIVAAVMRVDVQQFGPEVLKLLFHQAPAMPIDIPGAGSSTGSMVAVAGILSYLTGGSIFTLCCAVAVGAYFGQVALYRAFRSAFGSTYHRELLFAALLIPSEVFWSSGLIKEGVAMLGLGYLVYGQESLLRRVTVRGLGAVVFGAIVVGLFKAYILVAVTIATAVQVYFSSSSRRGVLPKPYYLALGLVIALGGNVVLSRLFPGYALENLAEQAAYFQEAGQANAGGSTYAIGDASQITLSGQLVYAPIALVTSLFRPFLFEARNTQVFVNTLETTAVLVLIVRMFARRRLPELWTTFTATPMLMFCLVFIFIFGIGVGLTTTNMGTLSRYRMPLVPFLWCIALVLRPRRGATVATANIWPITARGNSGYPSAANKLS